MVSDAWSAKPMIPSDATAHRPDYLMGRAAT